ncbi:MAG: heparan-alpha-glucosaminide N-acetyltransferase domain-containing protein, partial [Planctomycetota bacterium]
MHAETTDTMAGDMARGRSTDRVQEIDVLRGLALIGIVIIHHIEHFHVFRTPEHTLDWLRGFDPKVMSGVFFMISGKAYALFSVLFGLSFWIQVDRRRRRGQGYFWRHVWRMALLFAFGMVHTVFFSGDILHMYALIGVALIFFYRLPPALLLTLAITLIALPVHVVSLVDAVITGNGFDFRMQGEGWGGIDEITMSPGFFDDVRFNFGVLDEIFIWNWNAGRVLLVPGLFLLGVYAGRVKLLDRPARWWCAVLLVSAVASMTFWAIKNHALPMFNLSELDKHSLYVVLETHHRTAFMFVYASAVVLAWKLDLWRQG